MLQLSKFVSNLYQLPKQDRVKREAVAWGTRFQKAQKRINAKEDSSKVMLIKINITESLYGLFKAVYKI